jgi:hypothetical protein
VIFPKDTCLTGLVPANYSSLTGLHTKIMLHISVGHDHVWVQTTKEIPSKAQWTRCCTLLQNSACDLIL